MITLYSAVGVFKTPIMVGVRGMPERDIESLGVMGWGLDAARRFFRRRRRRRRRRRPPKVGV